MYKKKIIFLTGTRADYGKLKPLIFSTLKSKRFETSIIATGMHLQKLYGYTYIEIRKDFKSNKPMNRLIQGDVGCGKTIVAVLAASIIVGNNSQVAIIAPTEILAEQHYKTFSKYFKNFEINCSLLISNITKTNKDSIYKKLKNGDINIIVGTHAIIQENVFFEN